MQFIRHLLDDESNVEPNGLLCEISPDRWVAETVGGTSGTLVRLWDVEAGLLDEVAVPWPAGDPGSTRLVGGSINAGEVIAVWGRHVGVLTMTGDSLTWGGWVASVPGGGSDPYVMDFQYASGDGFKYCSGYPLLTGARDGQLTVFGGEDGLFRCVLAPGGVVVSDFETCWENDSDNPRRYFRISVHRTQTLANTSGGFDFVCHTSERTDESRLVSIADDGTVSLSPPVSAHTNPSEAVRSSDGSLTVIWDSTPPTVARYTLGNVDEHELPLVQPSDQQTSQVRAGATSTTPGTAQTGYMRPVVGGPPLFGLQDHRGQFTAGWAADLATSPINPGFSLTGGWFVHLASASGGGTFWRVWKWKGGGWWHLRQRQTLTGADGWPLRHLQAGANHGSYPLRQRQQGV